MAVSPRTDQAPHTLPKPNSRAQAGVLTTPKLADWNNELISLGQEIQLRHYSPKTLSNYSSWVKKFCAFTKAKEPALLGADDVKSFLTSLAKEKKVAAST